MVRFSFVVPCYNAASTIGGTLTSLLQQSIEAEVILVDDGSTDELDLALTPFVDRIRLVRQSNQGRSAARNAALACARGEFVVPVDADDGIAPDYLEQIENCLRDTPEADMLVPDTLFVGDHPWSGELESSHRPFETPVTVASFLANRAPSMGRAVFRTSLLRKLGGWDPRYPRSQDWDLALRMLVVGARVVRCHGAVYHWLQYGSERNREVGRQQRIFASHSISNVLRELPVSRHDRNMLEAELRVLEREQAMLALRGSLESGQHQVFRDAVVRLHTLGWPSDGPGWMRLLERLGDRLAPATFPVLRLALRLRSA